MTSATQTDGDSDKVLELITQSRMGLSIEEIYRRLSGDTDYQSPQFDPFGPEIPDDSKLDHARLLVDELKNARKIERNTGGRWQLVHQPFKMPEPRTASERPKSPVQVKQPTPVKPPKTKPVVSTELVTADTPKRQKDVVRPEVPYRDPKTQNEHHQKSFYDFRLTLAERICAAASHDLCYAQKDRDNYLSPSREIASSYLALKAGVSERCAQDAMTRLVKMGYFVRLDNGKGGRAKRSPQGRGYGATYRPVVPDFDQ